MTWINRLTYLLLALSLSFVSISVFLLNQYKQGIPYPFATSMTLAALIGLVAPLLAVSCFSIFAQDADTKQKYFVFYAVCIGLAVTLGLFTF